MATDVNTAMVAAAHSCWSCGEMRAAQFCKACGKVQPPQPVDYFSFFALPRKLDFDVVALEREFYKLSRRLHPDVYARATGDEKKQVVPPDLLEEVFELNLQLEELRAAKKMGEAADEQVVRDLRIAKQNFESRLTLLQEELHRHWGEWD